MKYTFRENKKRKGTYTYETELEGITIKPKVDKELKGINIEKILIVDEELISNNLYKKLMKQVSLIDKKFMQLINDDDTTDEDAAIVLDEVAKLKSKIVSNYKEKLTIEKYKKVLKELIMMEEEFKESYHIKASFKEMLQSGMTGRRM